MNSIDDWISWLETLKTPKPGPTHEGLDHQSYILNMGPDTRDEAWFLRPHHLDTETHSPYSVHTSTFQNRFT